MGGVECGYEGKCRGGAAANEEGTAGHGRAWQEWREVAGSWRVGGDRQVDGCVCVCDCVCVVGSVDRPGKGRGRAGRWSQAHVSGVEALLLQHRNT